MNLTFRDIGPADLPELVDLWVESWSEVYPDIDFNDRRSWFLDHAGTWTERGALGLAAFDPVSGLAVGFVLLDIAAGYLDQTCHLDQICVCCELKGSGAAASLMAEVKRLSPKGVTLDVNAINHAALRFYAKEGFVKTGEGVNPRSGLPILHYRWQP